MRGLSALELVHVWEVAHYHHPVDQALAILSLALPDVPRDEQLALSVGQRDAYLLAARQLTFGSQLSGFAECTRCQERLEFAFNVADIRVQSSKKEPVTTRHVYETIIDGYELQFRLPNSLDLAQIASYADMHKAGRALAQRCILRVWQHNQEGPIDTSEDIVDTLPESVLIALAEQMGHYDPQAEVQLELSCPACDQHWSILFDIVTFFWAEICAQAKRLLREVHVLASAYGWCEADILALSATRRQMYLEMVTR